MPKLPRTAHLIVCDDIRQEQGNKLSLIGVYKTDILVDKIPAVLPKLCFQIHVRVPASDPIKSLSIEFVGPGESKAELPAFEGLFKKAKDDLQPDSEILTYILNVVASPFEIASDDSMRVIAIVDGRRLPAGNIRFGIRQPTGPTVKKPKRRRKAK